MTRVEEIRMAALTLTHSSKDSLAFKRGAEWADSTYVKGDIEKEAELYAQGVVGDISEDIRHLLATAYIAGAKRIER